MIIFTHHTGEPHGMLGAQIAATFFQQRLSIPSIVVGIERDFSREQLFHFIGQYYAEKEKIVAFSHLCGRKDIIGLIEGLKQKGFITILGGPQARQDFVGEPDSDAYPHRFRGLNSIGCAYANKIQTVILPPPVSLREKNIPDLEVRSEGCIFCDVSRDKGYHGPIERDKVITQIMGLPEVDGRKIPFEIIDEYPIRSLGKLLEDTERHKIKQLSEGA